MAVSTILTGTTQSITATNGSANITTASTSGWVVGATVQGTGWAAGTKIVSFVANTSAVFSNNFTGTTGAASIIVSSNTGTLTVTLAASGDTASPQTLITNGFGLLRGNKTMEVFGFCKIILQIATGATWDDTEWVYELGAGSSLRFNESYGCGTWRSGYILNGSTYIKAKGATINYNNFDGSTGAGGRGICFQSGAPPGFVAGTTQPTFQWNDMGWYEAGGSNAAAILGTAYTTFNSGRIIFDYANDGSGANAGFTGSYGTIESLLLYRCIGGVSTGSIDTTKVTSIGKFEYFSLPATGTEIRMAFPNNVPFYGFAPLTYQIPATNTFVCMNTTSNEILVDYTFPTGLDVISNTKNYSNNVRTYRRTVSFTIKDGSGNALTNTTLYIKSGLNSLVNAVQSGDFNSPVNVAVLTFFKPNNVYVMCNSFVDTRQQTAQVRKYGYQQQSTTYNIQDAAYSQPFFMLTDSSVAGISEATAGALTNVNIAWENKVVTVTANATYDQINARIAYELAQTTGSTYADPRTITGANLSLASGWSIIVMPGITLTNGSNITYVYSDTFKALSLATAPYLFDGSGVLQSTGLLLSTGILNVQGTYTGTSQITAVYANTTGTSIVLELNTPSNGYSVCLYQGTTTKYFNSSLSTGSYYVYLSPSEAGTYTLAAENYGQKRTQDTLVLNGGNVWYNITDIQDVGITETTKATVAAYATIDNHDEFYDYTALKRLEETYIKLGQIATRNGSTVDISAPYSIKINQSASSVYNLATDIFTIKTTSYANGTKYDNMTLVPPATLTVTTNEVITANFEDANGDSSLTTLGGDGNFELWQITTSTPTDDYATGTLLATIGNEKFRFVGVTGYDIVGRDTNSGVRRRTSMSKGVYTQSFYVGEQIQLAQAPTVDLIYTNVQAMTVDIEAIKGTGFTKDVNSLINISDDVKTNISLSA